MQPWSNVLFFFLYVLAPYTGYLTNRRSNYKVFPHQYGAVRGGHL